MTQIPATPSRTSGPSFAEMLLTRIQRELVYTWRRTVAPGDMLALLVTLGLLLMPVFAIRAAGWAEGVGVLLPLTLLATALSFLLARSQFSELMALILHSAYGAFLVLGVNALNLPGSEGLYGKTAIIFQRLALWFETVNAGGVSNDTLIPTLFLSVLYWYLVLNTVWHLFRLERIWLAIVPPGLTLLVNNTNYVGDGGLDWYLAGYLFFALVLIAHSHMKAREYEWFRAQLRYSRQVRASVLRLGIIMTLLVMSLAWVFPAGHDSDNWQKFQEFMGEDPLQEIRDLWSRLFAGLEGRGIATADYYGGDRLDLSGPIQLGDGPVMQVEVDHRPDRSRMYWRSTIFDTYNDGSWTHRREVRAYRDSAGMTFNIGDNQARDSLEQHYTIDIPATSLVYAAPQPVEMGLPVEAEVNCLEGGIECVREGRQVDVALIRGRDVLRQGDEYDVVSSISVATADQLRSVPAEYPGWITERYLQGGDQISPNLRSLTQQIIAFNSAETPYDKAKAIEQWLRTNIAYDELIPPPPADKDPLDWFVFEIRRGYCNYYTSAMIMMLRSEGIPARMAAGFAEGDYNPTTRTYTVIERDAHTWVEVYFPGYGWVEFEPTADEPPLERPGDVLYSDNFPTPTPQPSPTPTVLPTNTPPPVPTATPTVTPIPSETPEGTPPGQETATPQPSPTPTVTATPTTTPTPDPEENVTPITDVADDNNGNFWRTALLILGIILGIILALVLAGLFMVWWVEYRGLGGLTPVQKAYARLAIYGRWLGIDLNALLTPDEQRRRLVEEVPEGRRSINTITGLYIEERFAPPRLDQTQERTRQREVVKRSWTQARLAFITKKLKRWLRRD